LLGNKVVRLATFGYGFMEDHPILQAADMLAYGEWQKRTNGNLEIYRALHRRTAKRGSTYVTDTFECTEKIIDLAKQGVAAVLAERKALGLRKPKEKA
jgi:hypothetical protein